MVSEAPIVMDCKLDKIFYGNFMAVRDSHVPIRKNEITGFIGPSGCGKSTVLRSLNRMNDLVKGCLLYTSPSPRDLSTSRMPSSA